MDKNMPANARNKGSIPGQGSCHMLQSSYACLPQILTPEHSRAGKLQLMSPCAATTEAHAPRACALHQGRPLQ